MNMIMNMNMNIPLTEEIRLEIFESRDLSGFPINLSSDGDFVYSTENRLEFLGLP